MKHKMKKQIFKYMAAALTLALVAACNDSESDLLKPKVYFENKEHSVELKEGRETMDVELTSRLSNAHSSEVNVAYAIADSSVVKEYNAKYGTDYLPFDAANAKIDQSTATIEKGGIYAGKVKLTLSNLGKLKDGKSYVLPVKLSSGDVPAISGTDIEYVIVAKPLRVTTAGAFSSHFISVKFPTGTFFKSFTYEALIYAKDFGTSNTILGTEGVMILRIGDTGGGIARGILQVAGRQHYEAPDVLQLNKWYHVALTFDSNSGKTVMYVNGTKWAESAWNIQGFDPNADIGFKIGKLQGFQWGARPFVGYMGELRVWSVARTENQIQQNMMGVDPKSDGLELYYKLNGSEKVENGKIKDSAKGIEGITQGIPFETLPNPVVIE
uniref:DUF1735 and LamG domain-containing protein n=1 Tax=Prevotella sp. GTC17262 TaxID=3236797 RepID=A0AB33JR00_9BACT